MTKKRFFIFLRFLTLGTHLECTKPSFLNAYHLHFHFFSCQTTHSQSKYMDLIRVFSFFFHFSMEMKYKIDCQEKNMTDKSVRVSECKKGTAKLAICWLLTWNFRNFYSCFF